MKNEYNKWELFIYIVNECTRLIVIRNQKNGDRIGCNYQNMIYNFVKTYYFAYNISWNTFLKETQCFSFNSILVLPNLKPPLENSSAVIWQNLISNKTMFLKIFTLLSFIMII